jgi:hypothetical protein
MLPPLLRMVLPLFEVTPLLRIVLVLLLPLMRVEDVPVLLRSPPVPLL